MSLRADAPGQVRISVIEAEAGLIRGPELAIHLRKAGLSIKIEQWKMQEPHSVSSSGLCGDV